MTPEEKQEIKEIFFEVFNERRGVEAEVHANHHRYITAEIEERKRRRDRYDDVRKKVIGWVIISSITGVISFVGYAGFLFYENIKRGLHL